MSQVAIDYLGWAATAVFVGSYFFGRPSHLRGAQMFGALALGDLWRDDQGIAGHCRQCARVFRGRLDDLSSALGTA